MALKDVFGSQKISLQRSPRAASIWQQQSYINLMKGCIFEQLKDSPKIGSLPFQHYNNSNSKLIKLSILQIHSNLSIILEYMDGSDQKSIKFLRQFADIAANYKNNEPNITEWLYLPNNIKHLKECLKENTLAVIIALHAYGALQPFLIFAVSELLERSTYIKFKINNQNQRRDIFKHLQSIISLIFTSSYNCFLERQGKVYVDLHTTASRLVGNQESPNESFLKGLLDQLAEIKSGGQTQDKRKKLNKFILQQLLIQCTNNLFDEVALNWIKKDAEATQRENEQLMCCRLVFQHKSTSVLGKFSESANQEFKDYRWPLENESIKFHLTKTVVGFLNTTGGIIYVGLREDKSKIIEVKGIKLSQQQKINFLYFLHNDILRGVYPKQKDRKQFQEDEAKDPTKETEYKKKLKEQFQSANHKKCEYRINKYVYVDFMDIYDKDTLMNSKEDQCGLYIARIKIKIGDSRELYHVIGQKHIPEAYFREDKSVKKKTIKEFYEIFYDRMKGVNSPGNEKAEQHANCRFSARCTEQIMIKP